MARSLNALFFILSLFLCSCLGSRKNYSPLKKYDRVALQQDYVLLKNILEQKHPSLYWYTPKDSMDFYFYKYYDLIKDSMTEQQYAWKILAPLVAKIQCGHTSVSMSKAYTKWVKKKTFPAFPLYMKMWNDSMLVMINLNKNDSLIKKGTLVTSVNGLNTNELKDIMFSYLPIDGNATSMNYIRMSANFPYYHRNIFGISKNYNVTYIDSAGNTKSATLPVYMPVKDSVKKKIVKEPYPKITKQKRLESYRSFKIDSSGKFAVIKLNSFSDGRLRQFFRQSFRKLKEQNITNLVLDIRLNGGGKVGLSTLLTKYVTRKPFAVADSLYAKTNNLAPYTKYIKGKFLNNLELIFITKKKKDGLYHINHLEKKTYNPKKNIHYNGNLYVLTAGPTFSAATLFCNAVKGQPGIELIGEETGGGWYGNNGIMIPDIILPATKLRVRLPLFRLVQYNHSEKNGSGVVPDILVETSYDALMNGYDKKMKVASEMILKSTR